MNKIYEIFKSYKYKLTLIYFFMLLTEVSALTQPYLLGKTIDDLINGGYSWLILLSISYLSFNFFHYKRMVYDTKVYTQIYNDIVFRFLNKTDTDDSTKIARTDMAHEIVGVLEGYVHYYISTIVTIVGSISFIYFNNYKVGLLVTIGLFVILMSVMVYYNKVKQSIRVRNDNNEKKIKSLQSGNGQLISFFNRKRRLDIYESTVQGKNWFLVGVIKNIFLIIGVVILVKTTKNITIGSVIMSYSYVNNFLISLLSIPVATEMYNRISDILKRID